jgi:hypothetical protein
MKPTKWSDYSSGIDWADWNEKSWVTYSFNYQAKLPEPKLTNTATVSGMQAMQSTQAQQAAFYNNLQIELQNHLGSLYQQQHLPAQPKVDLIESTFHLLSEKNRLMCTGKYNTSLKTEVLSERDSRTAVTRFQKFFCPGCAPYLNEYAAA